MNTDACSVEQNVFRCFAFFFFFFALDHLLCTRMIGMLTTILILFRRFQKQIDALFLGCKQRVSPFHHPSVHQISTLERTKFNQYSILSSLMSVRFQRVGVARDWCHGKQRVSPFCRTSQLAHSEEIDFLVWFSPGFLMQ